MEIFKNYLKVAVVGSRNYTDCGFIKQKVLEVLNSLKASPTNTLIISGGAYGVDRCAEKMARELQLPILVLNAQWNLYGRNAGPRRNSSIVQIADIVIAFPGPTSKGTYDTIDKSKKLRKKIFVFNLKS